MVAEEEEEPVTCAEMDFYTPLSPLLRLAKLENSPNY